MDSQEIKEGAVPWSASAPTKNDCPRDESVTYSAQEGKSIASQFLDCIAEGEGITFQTFDDTKGRHDSSLVRVLHGTFERHFDELVELNRKGAGVFFTVNATDLKGRSGKNITRVRAVFIDLDGAPLGPVMEAPLSPNLVVETSKERYHAYWLVEGLPLEQFSLVQKALIARFGADPAVHDLPRVMRLPGFLHRKGDPSLVKVIDETGIRPYRAEEIFKEFEIEMEAASAPQRQTEGDVLRELRKKGLVRGPLSNKKGAWEVVCPFVDQHTTGDHGTAYFEAYTNGYKGEGFKCQHAHCVDRSIGDVREFLGIEMWEEPLPLQEALHPVASFTADMLPETLRPWIVDVAERMQVPLDFLAAACVIVLGSLIGRKIGIYPKAHDDWLVIPNLWGAVVGRPSLLKSPAIAEMMRPLDALAAEALQKYKEEELLYAEKKEWFDAQKLARKDEMKKAARGKKGAPATIQVDPIMEPRLKRYKTEDGTVEKIGEILLENPQGFLIHRDELVGWLRSMDKQGREGDRAFYLESWNGNGSFSVDRIGRGSLHIPALCLSVLGGIQPGPLSAYVHEAISGGRGDDGLLQRLQLLVWPDPPKSWRNIDRPPNAAGRQPVADVFRHLDAFAPFEPSLTQDMETFKVRFSEDAQRLFDEWRTHLEQRLRTEGLGPALESHLAKYRSLLPSLALIFRMVETVGNGHDISNVDGVAVAMAIRWVEYLETHARRLYASGEDPSLEAARSLLEHIKRGDLEDRFSIRDVYYAKHWAKLNDAESATKAINLLAEFGWVKLDTVPTTGRPTVKVRIHPQLRNTKQKDAMQ